MQQYPTPRPLNGALAAFLQRGPSQGSALILQEVGLTCKRLHSQQGKPGATGPCNRSQSGRDPHSFGRGGNDFGRRTRQERAVAGDTDLCEDEDGLHVFGLLPQTRRRSSAAVHHSFRQQLPLARLRVPGLSQHVSARAMLGRSSVVPVL